MQDGMETKQRDFGLDLIRSVAIVLVILQHGWSGLELDVPSANPSWWVGRALCIGVPLFVMLSGALNLGRTPPPGEFLGKRFKRVLIPFLFWATIVFILSAAMGKYPEAHSFPSAVGFFFTALLEGRINASYWFVYLLSGLYLLTPLLQRAFDPSRPQTRTLLGYALLIWLGVQFFKAFYPSFLPVKYFSFPVDVFLGYYLAGFYLRQYVTDKVRLRRYGVVAFLAGAALSMVFQATGKTVLPAEMLEVCGLYGWLSTLEMPEGRLRRFTTGLSRYSYTVYLTQMVPVGALCTLWHGPAVTLPLLVLVVVLVEYMFCWCLDHWDKIPNSLVGI